MTSMARSTLCQSFSFLMSIVQTSKGTLIDSIQLLLMVITLDQTIEMWGSCNITKHLTTEKNNLNKPFLN